MPRLKLTLQYDGTGYVGWQVQPNGPSIQAAVQDACETIRLGRPPVTGASRTDAGVHATGQVCHVDLDRDVASPEAVGRSLNGVLPRDIRVLRAEGVADDFHARHDATAKVYRYLIATAPSVPPLLRRAVWPRPGILDAAAMAAAAEGLRGEHDFRAFQAAGSPVADTVRTIFDVRVRETHFPGLTPADQPLLAFDICGSGFLYKMVRSLAGTLAEIGTGRTAPDALTRLLESGARAETGQTAPAAGLCLRQVRYAAGPHVLDD